MLLPQRGASPSEADLIVALSIVTTASSMMFAFVVICSGTVILLASPEHFCYASSRVVSYMEASLNSSSTSSVSFSADDGINKTSALAVPTSTTTKAMAMSIDMMNRTKDLACSDMSGLALITVGLLVICFGFFVVVRLAIISSRLGRLARRAGGCSSCIASPIMLQPQTDFVYQGHNVAIAIPVHVGVVVPPRTATQMY